MLQAHLRRSYGICCQQCLHLCAQVVIVAAGFRHVRRALPGIKVPGRCEQIVDLAPSFRGHGEPSFYSQSICREMCTLVAEFLEAG